MATRRRIASFPLTPSSCRFRMMKLDRHGPIRNLIVPALQRNSKFIAKLAVPMLAKRIIPCLDVDRGRVVKGVHFVGLRDAGDPVEVARRYEADGADELVFLDISASHEGRPYLLDMIRRVAEQVFMPFTVGGGIRTLDDATQIIQAGAEKVSINSAAVKTPEFISQVARKFGSC